ncbi:MAG: UDP-glucose/GDP-mannose dehydrogenase family protein [Chloroflexi bacterium]|nr:UDP-glucose/GDP-mannose dehydrogenase family protein [Chloroflexota bacterium]
MSATLAVIGAGRSGAVTAACLADLGHTVCAVDINEERVAQLQSGAAPFVEPQLDAVIARNLEAGRLTFTTDVSLAVPRAEAVLLCLPTPAATDGSSDLSALHAAVDTVAAHLTASATIIMRSTVPVGTNAEVLRRLQAKRPDAAFEIVSNPEFLREGHAVDDFMRPDRIVIGAGTEQAAQAVAALYAKIDCPIVLTDLATAELAKYAANAYLAASVSFINEIANICERTGADMSKITETLALDRRIGRDAYLQPGIGFGGSCLPKDLTALIDTAEAGGYTPHLLRAIAEVNELQPRWVIERLEEVLPDLAGRSVAVLGISFKGGTFDPRSSPALAVIRLLANAGARVHAFDPLADSTAAAFIKSVADGKAELHTDAYSAAAGCHAIVIATDHSQFLELDLDRLGRDMESRLFIDGRNLFDPAQVLKAGFSYTGVGRARRDD